MFFFNIIYTAVINFFMKYKPDDVQKVISRKPSISFKDPNGLEYNTKSAASRHFLFLLMKQRKLDMLFLGISAGR
jgi:hypothetical protein